MDADQNRPLILPCAGGIFLLLVFALPTSAANIYKWVDENGQVHYSQKPSNQGGSKKMGKDASEARVRAIGACKTLTQQLVGDWRGKDGEDRIVFRFYERRGQLSDKTGDKGYYIDHGRQELLQGGLWKTRGTEIILTTKKIGKAAKKRNTFEKLMVAKIEPDYLYLLAGDESFRLKRYYGAGNLPSCFKR